MRAYNIRYKESIKYGQHVITLYTFARLCDFFERCWGYFLTTVRVSRHARNFYRSMQPILRYSVTLRQLLVTRYDLTQLKHFDTLGLCTLNMHLYIALPGNPYPTLKIIPSLLAQETTIKAVFFDHPCHIKACTDQDSRVMFCNFSGNSNESCQQL